MSRILIFAVLCLTGCVSTPGPVNPADAFFQRLSTLCGKSFGGKMIAGMFTKEGREVSNTNVWAFEVEPGQALVYELARPGRLFRISFDLARPLETADEE